MNDLTPYHAHNISAICPECGQAGTFDFHSSSNDIQVIRRSNNGNIIEKSGIRFCPNTKCRKTIFYSEINDNTKGVSIRSEDIYPKSLIDFSIEAIPETIAETFKEALECHSHKCYKAAGAMIRRTLEGLCSDRKCEGKNLHSRLEDLQAKIVVPQELLEAAFSLKLLGNDAAHIEAKTYDQIGIEEIELGIELTKELLKSVYQYKGLLRKLESYKKKEKQ